ncbi:MAG: aquaporin [Mariniphaga sp.]|nr:aquaporin [Mariniphaga sp.]
MQLLITLRKNLRTYLIEAWALGMFMVSASLFVILIEHPALPVRNLVEPAVLRRLMVGLAMGITAVLLIYSKWGKRSGAHMNPGVTLTFFMLHRISFADAFWYILFQFAGGYLGVAIFKWFFYSYISNPVVNYVVTIPGAQGNWLAFGTEFFLSLIIIATVLFSSNSKKIAPFTGYLVGVFLTLAITFTAPFSGMSINPARTFASSLNANEWQGWWIYFLAPVLAMLLGGYIYRFFYRKRNNGNCTTMRMHLSGYQYDCATYEVLGPAELLRENKLQNQKGI